MASVRNETTAAAAHATETTPLISHPQAWVKNSSWKAIHRVLVCGFLVSLSFGVTQVPLVYVFRVMTCDAYYDKHIEDPHGGDRCSIPPIEAGTAKAVALLGFSTTFFGLANLFITGWGIKRYGVKSTLALQVFWPAARLGVQVTGVAIGGKTGIIIVQSSQIMTIIGGPTGYLLALNSFVTDTVETKDRTGYLGILQGCTMFGSAAGFFLGGVFEEVNDLLPFEVATGLFLVSTFYVLLCLPYIPPLKEEKSSPKAAGLSRAFGPIRTLFPAKWEYLSGAIRREYGPLVLAAGVFSATLATGYIPTLLQLYATGTFNFGPRSNSYLVSSHLFLRGVFLTQGFPRILAAGRKFLEERSSRAPRAHGTENSGTEVFDDPTARALQDELDPDIEPSRPDDTHQTCQFDLVYTRFSLLIDGVITLGASLVRQGWQMYLISALLPFGAGTASAAKGTILQMCPTHDRVDALAAISLVEMAGRLSTTFVFGLVFAAFASISKTYLVFVCNAGVALVGFTILQFANFPPDGSRRLDMHSAASNGAREQSQPEHPHSS